MSNKDIGLLIAAVLFIISIVGVCFVKDPSIEKYLSDKKELEGEHENL